MYNIIYAATCVAVRLCAVRERFAMARRFYEGALYETAKSLSRGRGRERETQWGEIAAEGERFAVASSWYRGISKQREGERIYVYLRVYVVRCSMVIRV